MGKVTHRTYKFKIKTRLPIALRSIAAETFNSFPFAGSLCHESYERNTVLTPPSLTVEDHGVMRLGSGMRTSLFTNSDSRERNVTMRDPC